MSDLQHQLQTALGDAYRIERELGGGGMSRVFVAHETALGRQVVVKVLPPEMSAGVNIERFRREIQLAASLQHPHILPVHATAQAGDVFYYTMPLVEGESLRAKLAREGELPIADAIRLLSDVVDGLAYAHAHGVVHRDIKPDNILISGQHAVVTDFGVAKAMSAATGRSSLTSIGVALGTPAYMAPEQAAADPNVDHRADLYAVGAMAYEMLAGRPPFSGMSAQQVLAAHVATVPAQLSTLRASVPRALNDLVMRLLEKKPADRVQTASEVLAQLQAVMSPSGGMAPAGLAPAAPALTSGEAHAIRRAHPVRVAVVFGLVSIGILAAVLFLRTVLGLPDWVVVASGVLLLLDLPIILGAARVERAQLEAMSTGTRLPPSTGIARLFTWKRAISAGGAAFVALAVTVVGYTAMRAAGIGSIGTLQAKGLIKEKQAILLADFENRAADSTLGPTLTEALRVDLSQSATVRLVDAGTVSGALTRMQKPANAPLTIALSREVAEREGVPAVVSGEIDAVGKSYLLSARILSAGNGSVLTAVRESAANDTELIPALDRLSRALRERIGESLVSIRADEPLARVTTGSLDALHKYTQAVQFARIDDNERAIQLLEEATALDTGFAMAWRKMAALVTNSDGSTVKALGAATRAFEHRDRLPELERQATIAYYFDNVDYDPVKAEAAYRAMLAIEPDNDIALNNLALNSLTHVRYAEAESLSARCVGMGVYGSCIFNLIASQSAQGKDSAADSTLARWAAAAPNNQSVAQAEYLRAARRRDFATAEIEARALQSSQSSSPYWREVSAQDLASIAGTLGKLGLAEQRFRAAADAGEARGLAGEYLQQMGLMTALLVRHRGNSAPALAVLDSALLAHPLSSIEPLDRPYPMLATAYAIGGRPDEAQKFISEMDRVVPEGVRRSNFFRYMALADIASARGKPREVIANARAAREVFGNCPNCGFFEMGEAFAKLGQPDSATFYYVKSLHPLGSFELYRGLTRLAVTYQRLGELYEARGERAKAIEYYRKLTDLWKNADPELQPIVKDAQARIARLSAGTSG